MKNPEKKPKPKKRTVAVKDLTAKDATKVKGGLTPQLFGDHKTIVSPTINPSLLGVKLYKE
jgi:hypothetical protein